MEIRKYQDLSDNVGLVMVRQVIATLKQPHFTVVEPEKVLYMCPRLTHLQEEPRVGLMNNPQCALGVFFIYQEKRTKCTMTIWYMTFLNIIPDHLYPFVKRLISDHTGLFKTSLRNMSDNLRC